MKKRIYFIDEDSSSRHNGIGTFRRMFIKAMASYKSTDLCLISLNAPVAELVRRKCDFGMHYSVPRLFGGSFRESGPLLWPLLSMYINDDPRNIFIFNHSPCSGFISSFKETFPMSRTVFIIHDQGWNASLMGDSGLLRSIVVDGVVPNCVSESTAQFVRDYCEEERHIYRLVDKVVCLCRSTADILGDVYGLDSDRFTLIPNGYECDATSDSMSRAESRSDLGITPDTDVVIFAARSAKHKGIEAILKSVALLRELRPLVRCVVATRIEAVSKYERLIASVASSLIFTGHLTPDELRKWYVAANIGVMSSYTEQCSYSAMEMMDCGLTIVSSNGYGLSDMFADGRNAFVADVGNVLDDGKYIENIVLAIERALSASPTELDVMKTENRRLLDTTHSLDAMAEGYLKLFSEIVD